MASLGQTSIGERGNLSAEDLMSDALARAGRSDYADRTFVGPLHRLIDAYNTEADLSAFGRYSVQFDAMRCLKNLLHFDAVEETRPEILARPIAQPIFIMGLPRSGTTFLHSLLAQDPSIVVPLSWQSIYPYPANVRVLGVDLQLTWLNVQFGIMKLLSRELSDLHPLSVTGPQECTDITAQVFQSLRFDSTYRVPSYQDWLGEHGHLDAYRFHRRFLQHLDAQSPGRRWVLKSPDHVFALHAIRAVYPDAHIVFLHRDPLSVLASVAKLTEVLRRPFARSVDREDIGRQVSSSWADGANRMIEASKQSDSILHLHYRDVVSSPMNTVMALYRHCGLSLSPDARTRMQTWLDQSPKNGNRQNDYRLSEFGLDPEVLRDRFKRYMDVFSVAPEWEYARSPALRVA
jgi:Sulfotransferase family